VEMNSANTYTDLCLLMIRYQLSGSGTSVDRNRVLCSSDKIDAKCDLLLVYCDGSINLLFNPFHTLTKEKLREKCVLNMGDT
jgi:hypothetical protein